jgi:hypothetical protein
VNAPFGPLTTTADYRHACKFPSPAMTPFSYDQVASWRQVHVIWLYCSPAQDASW